MNAILGWFPQGKKKTWFRDFGRRFPHKTMVPRLRENRVRSLWFTQIFVNSSLIPDPSGPNCRGTSDISACVFRGAPDTTRRNAAFLRKAPDASKRGFFKAAPGPQKKTALGRSKFHASKKHHEWPSLSEGVFPLVFHIYITFSRCIRIAHWRLWSNFKIVDSI